MIWALPCLNSPTPHPDPPPQGGREMSKPCHMAIALRSRWRAALRRAAFPAAPQYIRRSSGVPDARIDQPVGQLDQQVDGHDDGADQQCAALEDRIVAAVNRLDQPLADARPGK